MFPITREVLPYDSLAHWPPMTYRNNQSPSPQTMSAFKDCLSKENDLNGPKELQPWIPFCEGRCAFCYFPVNCQKEFYDNYIRALKKVLHTFAESRYVKTSVFSELYVGGGSPSVLSEEQILDILSFCNSNFNLGKDSTTKFTACTTDLTSKKIALLAKANVSQLDIGIQSFNEDYRRVLTLRDSDKQAISKLREAKKNGLGVSIDLLYNLPGQTVEQWKMDLKQALELEVESVDCYPLDLYGETPLAKKIAAGQLPPVGDYRKELELYLSAYKIFKDNGYFPTCHNRFSRLEQDRDTPSVEVVGTGAGFFMGHINRFHYSDLEDVKEYIGASQNQEFPISRLSEMTLEDEMRKAIMMIYVRVPINRHSFKAKFGKYPEDAFPKAFEKLRSRGLILEENDHICLSEKGDPWRFNIAWDFFN